MSRHPVERIGLLTIALGIIVAVVVAGLIRILRVAPEWEVRGFTAYKTYPLVPVFVIIGIVVVVIGLAILLIGKAVKR